MSYFDEKQKLRAPVTPENHPVAPPFAPVQIKPRPANPPGLKAAQGVFRVVLGAAPKPYKIQKRVNLFSDQWVQVDAAQTEQGARGLMQSWIASWRSKRKPHG